MSDKNITVVVLTREKAVCETLQAELQNFRVVQTRDVKEIHSIAESDKPTGAIVLDIKDSTDWVALDFVRTAYPSIPCFIILEKEDFDEDQESAIRHGAMAVVESSKAAALSALIIGSANNNLRKNEDLDKNAAYLRTLGDLSRELGRLQGELTETLLRTLPQPVIGMDTRNRLTLNLELLQKVSITP